MKNIISYVISAVALASSLTAHAQSELYPEHFDLEEVTLLDGPMKTAMDKNVQHLLRYDTDRLLTPFIRQAGLSDKSGSKYYGWTSKHPTFPNWGDSGWSLEGHVGGHYMSALALAYAACHNESSRTKLKDRMDYILGVLEDCQNAYSTSTNGMKGFIGGQPINQVWTGLYNNNIDAFRQYGGWVPFYCQHKVLAGLRDVYLYADGETAIKAKQLYRGLADWSVNVVSKLDTNTMQQVLGWEHGGMNETLADAYHIFKNDPDVSAATARKYLTAAKKYSHQYMIDGMKSLNTTFLNGKHANTQVPKYIGFERIYEEDATMTDYRKSAENFWQDVATHRTVCIGGNSVNEHFLGQDGNAYVNELDGPESCNTNNMLKLSENLFDRTHDAKYADFYEAAMWNHILSTQDPETGGYVYFTPLRPQNYKIYSVPNKGMWCCVGTGMENHSKYGHFIYTHSTTSEGKDILYVNLFTASELNSEKFGLKQETQFPYEQHSRITITKAGHFTLAIRRPSWIDGSKATYTFEEKDWKVGDVVEIDLPMSLRYEECPNLHDYIAFKYGPILLGARTTKVKATDAGNLQYEKLNNEYGGEGRMDHSEKSMTKALSLSSAPLLIGKRSEVLNRIKADENSASTLTFTIDASRPGTEGYKWTTLTLQPYYTIHHSRMMNYWYQQTEEEYAKSSMALSEQEKAKLEERTIDFVATGEQQSEAGHEYKYSTNTSSGSYNGEFYRDAQATGYIQYNLYNPDGISDHLGILCRFTKADKGRKGTLTVDGTKIADIEITGNEEADDNGFFNKEISLPESIVYDKNGNVKKTFTVRLSANKGTICPGFYYLRLTYGYQPHTYVFSAPNWVTGDASRVAQSNIKYDNESNTITLKAGTGANNVCLGFDFNKSPQYRIGEDHHYLLVCGSNLSTQSGKSYLWWLNGSNHGSSVAPAVCKSIDADHVVIAWDIRNSGIAENCQGDRWSFNAGNTIFGLTSTTGTSVISDICFVSDVNAYIEALQQAVSIHSISTPSTASQAFYTLDGTKHASAKKGINIIKQSNGRTQKKLFK